MIKIISDGVLNKPAIVCDVCKKQICSGDSANVVWSSEGGEGDILFVHRGACDRVVEKILLDKFGASTRWMMLEEFVFYLLGNTRISEGTLKEAGERAIAFNSVFVNGDWSLFDKLHENK
jgi:hypothetical protein